MKSISLDTHPDSASLLHQVRTKHIRILKKGVLAALVRGPKVGGPVIHTQVVLHNLVVTHSTADSFLMSAASQCVQKVYHYVITLLFDKIIG